MIVAPDDLPGELESLLDRTNENMQQERTMLEFLRKAWIGSVSCGIAFAAMLISVSALADAVYTAYLPAANPFNIPFVEMNNLGNCLGSSCRVDFNSVNVARRLDTLACEMSFQTNSAKSLKLESIYFGFRTNSSKDSRLVSLPFTVKSDPASLWVFVNLYASNWRYVIPASSVAGTPAVFFDFNGSANIAWRCVMNGMSN
jgi:hypothetical protein